MKDALESCPICGGADHIEPLPGTTGRRCVRCCGIGGFCTLCSHRVESFEGLTACPKCGYKGVPCRNEHQVSVGVNIHELRVLCIWAENWAHHSKGQPNSEWMPDIVYAIASRLRRQIPKPQCLTMADEFAAMRERFPNFETNHPANDGMNPFQEPRHVAE